MITLIGHGYVGDHVAQELQNQQIPFTWIHHTEQVPVCTNFIINAAGYTGSPNVDACEVNRQSCVNGNVIWPVQLEQANPHTPCLHISSGCVYTGYKPHGYTEQDAPNFDFDTGSFYSATKALAQTMLTPYMHKSYLFRIRMPFGRKPHPKNLLTKLETYAELVNFENSMTNVEDLARVVVWFCLNRPWTGIYNVCNPGSLHTRQLADWMGISKNWMTESEFLSKVKAPRSNCVLNVSKLQRVCPITPVEYSMQECIRSYLAHKTPS